MPHFLSSTLLAGALALSLVSTQSHAADTLEPVKAQTAQDMSQQRRAIENELASGDRYVEISSSDRASVLAALTRLDATLAAAGHVDHIDAEQRRQFDTDLEQVNTTLERAAADSRVSCVRERTMGSHRRTNVCMTAAQRARLTRQSQDALDQDRSRQ